MKTEDDIKQDVYNLIKGSDLEAFITGELCREDRPLCSENEDITINVPTNKNGQIQEAYAYVNIYVPDEFVQDHYQKNTLRVRQIERLAADLLNVYNSKDSYRITLESQVTDKFESTNEHIIINRLFYKQSNE